MRASVVVVVVGLVACALCAGTDALQATQYPGAEMYNNYQPAYMLSMLPGMFNAQQRQRLSQPTGHGVGGVYPFQTHANDFSDHFGLSGTFAPLEWDSKHGGFKRPVMHKGPVPSTMSFKRFFQSTNHPLSGTFMPLDLLHARHYALWNPMFPAGRMNAVANAGFAGLQDFAMHFGEDPSTLRR